MTCQAHTPTEPTPNRLSLIDGLPLQLAHRHIDPSEASAVITSFVALIFGDQPAQRVRAMPYNNESANQ